VSEKNSDWWRPAPGSKAEQRFQFIEAALGIAGTSFAVAAATWTFASSEDGRMKALLWWAFGATAFGAFVIFWLVRRESTEVRYGRTLGPFHEAHHRLRDAAYERYIAASPRDDWNSTVEESLREFASAFSIALGANCHATIKTVAPPDGATGQSDISSENLEVDTFARSAK